MLQRIWTVSNLLSFSRVLLLAPLAYFLFSAIPNSRMWVGGIMLVAAATDFLDGWLARRLHQVTDLGKIIDPVADKIAVGGSALLFVIVGAVPLWYVLAIVVRDILILAGSSYIRSKKNIITQSNWPGKIAVSLTALALMLSVLEEPSLHEITAIVLWSSVVVMVASLEIYIQRLFIGNGLKRRSTH